MSKPTILLKQRLADEKRKQDAIKKVMGDKWKVHQNDQKNKAQTFWDKEMNRIKERNKTTSPTSKSSYFLRPVPAGIL